jgi:BirA family biotin operon repressor/biotin-[acetyl-CoA-carboxylase] ligase
VDGAKIAGILVESISTQPLAVAIGMGINIAHSPASPLYPATHLKRFAGEAKPETVFAALRSHFNHWHHVWNSGSGFSVIRDAWCARAHDQGEQLRVRNGSNAVEGQYQGLGADGELLLRTSPGHIERIFAGDVAPAREHT